MPPLRRRQRARTSARPSSVHVLDLALIYAELERSPGVTQADIARKYRKSAGYVSVLCRLGQAVRTLPPEARETLRVRHVTFKAAQVAVSRHPSPRDRAGLVAALQELAAGRPTTPARRRSTTGGTAEWREPVSYGPDEDPIDPLPLPAAFAKPPAEAYVFRWDAAAVARDPAAVLEAYERFVRETTADVVLRLRVALGDRERRTTRATGSAEGAVPRGGAASGPSGPAAAAEPSPTTAPTRDPATTIAGELSLRQLTARVDAQLKAHRERMAEFLAERERARARRASGAGAVMAPDAASEAGPQAAQDVTTADLDADCA